MSWAYWGIVIGLAALVAMLVVCVDFLSPDRGKDRQGSSDGSSGSVDMNTESSHLSKRAA
jgi:hypothetical protein